MAIRQVAPLDTAWLMLESRDTPMHVGSLSEFTIPEDAGPGYLQGLVAQMRAPHTIPPPWNLKLVGAPLIGQRLPLMREDHDVDLEYHVRHSALPHPGGQRELGILVSRLHSHQLDLHRPLWEAHVIEGLEGGGAEGGARFALYMKLHHSLIDGVSGMRLILRALSADPDERGMPPFWTVGAGKAPRREGEDGGPAQRLLGAAQGGAKALAGISRAAIDLGRAAIDDRPLKAPYVTPASALGGQLEGQRRFATQQYDLGRLKALSKAADCTLNDIVLYLSSTALRHYLAEHGRVPDGSMSVGIPVNLRSAEDQSTGTSVGMMVAELGTNVANPRERLEVIRRSTSEAKQHLAKLPPESRMYYSLLINGPWIAGLVAGLGSRAPLPFSVGISNVPGPPEPCYFNGARLDAVFPLSLLLHGNALNITCLSYAGTLNFGFTGARDTLPHLQHLALCMGEALEEIEAVLGEEGGPVASNGRGASKGRAPAE